MMKKTNPQRPTNRQSGQTIVMMAFLIIGLVAALGLAIDGGRLFLARRDTQNAVDAAILAATHALCTGRDPIPAGIQAPAKKGLTHNGDDVIFPIFNPPLRPMVDDDGNTIQED